MRKAQNFRAGWTYPDIIVALGIAAVLVALTTINLFNAQSKSNQNTTVDSLAADMALQQTRAMSGDLSAGGANSAYGIYFQPDRYVLFKGNSYSAGDPENFPILLAGVSFSNIGFPDSQIIYASKSGEFANFAAGQNTLVMSASGSGEIRTLHVNSYGVLYAVD